MLAFCQDNVLNEYDDEKDTDKKRCRISIFCRSE